MASRRSTRATRTVLQCDAYIFRLFTKSGVLDKLAVAKPECPQHRGPAVNYCSQGTINLKGIFFAGLCEARAAAEVVKFKAMDARLR